MPDRTWPSTSMPVLAAVQGETVTHLVVTHTHIDHSPATRHIKAATGAPSYGFGPHGGGQGPAVEEGADRGLRAGPPA